ncbi:MAG: transporter substrate-binding domain-containing protein [bacterium]|nr:transporter substrate-binding domain-containing protein [bacterium]
MKKIIILVVFVLSISLNIIAQNKVSPSVELTQKEQNWLKLHPVISVQNEKNWPPFNFNENDKPLGLSIDYMNLIAEKIGIKINYISGSSWNTFIKMIKNKELDLILNIVKTEERLKYINFTEPYVKNPNVIVSSADRPFSNLQQLKGKTITFPKGFFYEEILRESFPDIKRLPLKNTLDCLMAVSIGKADATLGEGAVNRYLMLQNMLSGLKISGEVQLGNKDLINLRIGVRKDWPILVSILNKAMKAVSRKEIAEIRSRWLLKSADQRKTIKLSAEEIKWLDLHPIIKFSGDPDWMPQESFTENGKYIGIAADYLKEVEKKLNIDIDIVPSETWDQTLRMVKNNTVDMISETDNEGGRKFLDFTKAYINFPIVVVLRKDEPSIRALNELKEGKKISIVKDYGYVSELKQNFPSLNYIESNTVKEGLMLVASGQVDAFIGSISTIGYLIPKLGLDNLKIGGETSISIHLSYGVRKDWPILISILNKAINSIPQEDVNVIINKWIKTKFVKQVDYSIIWKIMIAVVIIIILILIWARSLKKEIRNRKKAEEALEKNRQRLQTILDNASVAITMKDIDGRYILINKYYEEVAGASEDEIIGKTDKDIFDSDLAKRVVETDRNALLTGEINTANLDAKLNDGSLHSYISTKIPLKDKNGKVYALCGISTDITEIKQIQNELAVAKKTAEDATKSKSDFLANMSHEIRTPMNAVIGMTHLALQTELSRKQFDYLSKIDISAKSLLKIINDILDFSKIEAGKMDIEEIDFDLDKVLDNLANIISVKAKGKENLELLFNVDPDIPIKLRGDPLRLGQVLINLCNNAVKFTEVGEIIVTIQKKSIYENKADIQFSISDSGIGMTKEQLNKLFKSFSQADTSTTRKFGGTGLGLAISKQLVEMMGGQIRVESEQERGSTFIFNSVFSLQDDKLNEGEKLLPKPDLRALKTLVVDDNSSSREIIQRALESLSFAVKAVSSGQKAIEELENCEEHNLYKLVIMDWKMPEMDGLETIREIKLDKKVKILPKFIMVTAYGREDVVKDAEEMGVDGFLVKPFNNSVLFDTVIECFREKTESEKKLYYKKKNGIKDLKPIQGAKILLTDDNEINRQVGRELLENMLLDVSIAINGREAVDKVLENSYDIVLMDIQMPVMDGFEATKKIRSNGKRNIENLPIIAMTANAMAGDREKSINAGMDDHITKPIDPEKLLQAMLKWIPDKERKIPDHLQTKTPEGFKTKNEMLFSKLEGISSDIGLRNVNGNKDLYLNLLKKFYSENKNLSDNIKQAFLKNDIDLAQRLAHTVKGVAGSIGAVGLQKISGKIELFVKENDKQNFDKFITEFSSRLDYVISSLSKLGTETEKPKSENVGTFERLCQLLKELEEFSRTRKLKQSKEVVKELRDFTWPTEYSDDVMDICNFISRYKFEKAYDMLVNLNRTILERK